MNAEFRPLVPESYAVLRDQLLRHRNPEPEPEIIPPAAPKFPPGHTLSVYTRPEVERLMAAQAARDERTIYARRVVLTIWIIAALFSAAIALVLREHRLPGVPQVPPLMVPVFVVAVNAIIWRLGVWIWLRKPKIRRET